MHFIELPSVQGYRAGYCNDEEVCIVIVAHVPLLPAVLSSLGFHVQQRSYQILERVADLIGQVLPQHNSLLTVWVTNIFVLALGP